jgi:4-methyl-5(b-hydroxyethyl)-thiazole monophosphate biosynthesis
MLVDVLAQPFDLIVLPGGGACRVRSIWLTMNRWPSVGEQAKAGKVFAAICARCMLALLYYMACSGGIA